MNKESWGIVAHLGPLVLMGQPDSPAPRETLAQLVRRATKGYRELKAIRDQMERRDQEAM